MRHQFDKDYPYKDRAELISAAVSNVEGSMFFVDSGDGTGLPHLNRLVFQSKFLRGHRCTIPAWSLLPRIEHFFTEVSRLRIERASRRKAPAISGAFPRRIRLLSSPNVTSRDQCNEFSIPQWPRRCFASRVTDTGRLLIENTTSCESLSRSSRSR